MDLNRTLSRIALATFALCLAAAHDSLAQPTSSTADASRRIRGVIDVDDVWSGRVLITDDAVIENATITVEPGTTIEFVDQRPDHHPSLTVGGPDTSGGRILAQGTPDRPIRFRTQPGANAGRLIVDVRGRVITRKFDRKNPISSAPGPLREPGVLEWRHVVFEGLGFVERKHLMNKDFDVARPGVTFTVSGAGYTLDLTQCRWERGTCVSVLAADGARVRIGKCASSGTAGRACLEIAGMPGRPPALSDHIENNVLDAAVQMGGAKIEFFKNLVIGVNAAVALDADAAADSRVVGNYIHNTSPDDDGRYGFKSEQPDAAVYDNVFRGGTNCVQAGTRTMSGNMLIAAPKLNNPNTRRAMTHHLVASLPVGAVFERNLLLGPAFSLITVADSDGALSSGAPSDRPSADAATSGSGGPGDRSLRIRNNTFDGFGETAKAIEIGPVTVAAPDVQIENNLFLRVPTMVLANDRRHSATGGFTAASNAAAPAPARPLIAPKPGLEQLSNFEVYAEPGELLLSASLSGEVPDSDAELVSGKLTVSDWRNRIMSGYRPQAASPLVNAGRPSTASDAAPTIGALEPAR